jgi:hypothetical protein
VHATNARTLISPVIPPHPSLTHDNWLASFPLRSFLELGADKNAEGSARCHARNVLAEWRLDDLSEAVTLVVSELITNAVNATAKVRWAAGLPPVRLWLLGGAGSAGAGEVLVLVWDAVREMPRLGGAGTLDECGRGLGIVHTLSGRQWDTWLPAVPYGGKVTRALIDQPWRDPE